MMIRRVLASVALFGLVAASPAALVYPSTPMHPVVKAWAQRQSALTLSYLQAQPSYSVYVKPVAVLVRTSTERFGLPIAGGHDVYLRQTPPQQQAQLVEGGAEDKTIHVVDTATGQLGHHTLGTAPQRLADTSATLTWSESHLR